VMFYRVAIETSERTTRQAAVTSTTAIAVGPFSPELRS
jgi:hypothetical protein